jgi:hypothetical protein
MISTAPRQTPQTTIEAILYCVRERGIEALKEPANQQRLLNCDAAARSQINERIGKLIAGGRPLIEGKVNA